MSYIAKYLPVEGEIKEGDRFLSKWRKEHKFFWYPRVDSMSDTHYIWENTPYDKSDAESKVKLFLTSTNINFGEEVIALDTPLVKFRWNEQSKHAAEIANSLHLYVKIIGEISSGAIFVKEGDKFDEEDIRIVWWPNKSSKSGFGSFESMEIANTYTEFIENGYVEKYKSEVVYEIQIKCPTCKTFH